MHTRLHRNIGFLPRCLLLLSIVGIFTAVTGAQQIPATQAKTLDGTAVNFPDAASGKPLLLVVGFSHKGGAQCEAWNKQLAPVYRNDARVWYYQAADFQGVPSLIMKMILHGMRRENPASEQSSFVLLESNEQEWKYLVNLSSPDDAYVIVANAGGQVVWQTHGPVNATQVAALQPALAKLLAPKP